MFLFRSRAERRRAERLLVLRFFGVIGLLTVLFAVAMAGRYLLGWW